MTPRSIIAAVASLAVAAACQNRSDPVAAAPNAAIDRDLLDITVPRLRQLYADKKYTVGQVVRWHLDRIDRYNGVYGAIETVLRDQALAAAAREDAESGGTHAPQRAVRASRASRPDRSRANASACRHSSSPGTASRSTGSRRPSPTPWRSGIA